MNIIKLGFIRHEPIGYSISGLYYAGKRQHKYDFEVTNYTTVKDLTTFVGTNGEAFTFFSNILLNKEHPE